MYEQSLTAMQVRTLFNEVHKSSSPYTFLLCIVGVLGANAPMHGASSSTIEQRKEEPMNRLAINTIVEAIPMFNTLNSVIKLIDMPKCVDIFLRFAERSKGTQMGCVRLAQRQKEFVHEFLNEGMKDEKEMYAMVSLIIIVKFKPRINLFMP